MDARPSQQTTPSKPFASQPAVSRSSCVPVILQGHHGVLPAAAVLLLRWPRLHKIQLLLGGPYLVASPQPQPMAKARAIPTTGFASGTYPLSSCHGVITSLQPAQATQRQMHGGGGGHALTYTSPARLAKPAASQSATNSQHQPRVRIMYAVVITAMPPSEKE